MCGRYALYSQDMILSKYNFKIKKNYNVSPNQEVTIIIKKNELISLKWGIQPEWKKTLIINARNETINEKKDFQKSL